jgi:hypothetical protein
MSPASLIADLDELLEEAGETITLRRLSLGPSGVMIPFDCEVRASIRPVRSEELVSTMDQSWSRVVTSPTMIDAAQWPLPVKKGDKIVHQGKVRNVEFPQPIYVQGTLVRIVLLVAG